MLFQQNQTSMINDYNFFKLIRQLSSKIDEILVQSGSPTRFKSKIANIAINENKTMIELAAKYKINQIQITEPKQS